MTSVWTLWFVSLAIAGAAILIMIALLFGRLIKAWTGRAHAVERERIIPLLLRPEGRAWLERRPDIVTEVAVELIQLVRGSDRDRFIETAIRMGVPARLRRRLRDASPRLRMEAAEALAEFHDVRSVEMLHKALGDWNRGVRLTAALSLAALGRAPSPRMLVDLLGIGTRENSLLAVGLFRDIASRRPDEVKALILDDEVPAGAKAAAIEALSSSADYALVPLISTLAETADPDDPALPRYLRALGWFGHPAAEPAIRRCLGVPYRDVRAAAAEAAGKIGLASLAERLKLLLSDPEWWVRYRAAEALTRVGPEGARLLRQTAGTACEPARSAAALTMAERGLS